MGATDGDLDAFAVAIAQYDGPNFTIDHDISKWVRSTLRYGGIQAVYHKLTAKVAQVTNTRLFMPARPHLAHDPTVPQRGVLMGICPPVAVFDNDGYLTHPDEVTALVLVPIVGPCEVVQMRTNVPQPQLRVTAFGEYLDLAPYAIHVLELLVSKTSRRDVERYIDTARHLLEQGGGYAPILDAARALRQASPYMFSMLWAVHEDSRALQVSTIHTCLLMAAHELGGITAPTLYALAQQLRDAGVQPS